MSVVPSYVDEMPAQPRIKNTQHESDRTLDLASETPTLLPSLASRSRLIALPPEILIDIVQRLHYTALENLRRTCLFCWELPSVTVIQRAKAQYVDRLISKERAEAIQQELAKRIHGCWPDPYHIHANVNALEDRLHCFTCLSYLTKDRFTRAQQMGKRSLGHKQASRRFCIACGVKEQRWARGSILKARRGRLILCVCCRRLRSFLDFPGREFRSCSSCYPLLKRVLRNSVDVHDLTPYDTSDNDVQIPVISAAEVWNESSKSLDSLDQLVGRAAQVVAAERLLQRSSGLGENSKERPVEKVTSPLEAQLAKLTIGEPSKRYEDKENNPQSRRECRCMRCWMVDHTARHASVTINGQMLCEVCERKNRLFN